MGKCARCGWEIPKGTTHRCGIVPRVVRKGGKEMAKKRTGVKWGKIGAPHSAKRKAWMKHIAKKR